MANSGKVESKPMNSSLRNLCVLCVSAFKKALGVVNISNAETQRSRVATNWLVNYTEGVREFQPRVSTLETRSDVYSVTPQALANTFGVNHINSHHSQRSRFAPTLG